MFHLPACDRALTAGWPADVLDPNVVSFTFDVEWACQDVIDDVCSLLDERGITGTFFVTHDGVDVGSHERGVHPNFRRDGDVYKLLADARTSTDREIYEHVVRTVLTFAPEARGVRSHSLFFDSSLLPVYARFGLEYDSTLRLELVSHLRPFWKHSGMLEIPTYYADYFDLMTQATGLTVAGLQLAEPGMKVFDFHPNLLFINAPDLASYEAIRPFYRDADRLAAARHAGRGTRTLFMELLDAIAARNYPVMPLGAINEAVRR